MSGAIATHRERLQGWSPGRRGGHALDRDETLTGRKTMRLDVGAAVGVEMDTVLEGGRVGQIPRVSVLGRFGVELGERTLTFPFQAQRVIAYLAVTGGHERRDRLAGHLWPFSAQQRADANLRTAIWRIGSETELLIDSSRSHVGLRPGVVVDCTTERTQARSMVDGVPPPAATPAGLWERELLPGWDEDWLTIERERMRQLRIHALEALSRLCTAQKRYVDAIDVGLTAVAMEPLRESAQLVLIEAYLAEGNVSEAIRQLSTYRALLKSELGIEPSIRLQQLVCSSSSTPHS